MNIIAAAWTRVSSPGQADPSLGDQLSAIRSKASERRNTVTEREITLMAWRASGVT